MSGNEMASISENKLISIFHEIRREQLFLKQENESITSSVQKVNDLKASIPLLLMQIRELGENITTLRTGTLPVETALTCSRLMCRVSPLGNLKQKYDELLRLLRSHPESFVRLCSHIIFSKTATSSVQKDQNLLASLVVYSFYGNISNKIEEKYLLQFIKTCTEIACEHYDKPADILQNSFLKKLLVTYTRRRGVDFLKFIVEDNIIDIIQKVDFEVKPGESTQPEPKSKRSRSAEMDAPSSPSRKLESLKLKWSQFRIGTPRSSPPTTPRNQRGSWSLDDADSIIAAGDEIVVERKASTDAERRQCIANLYSVCTKIIGGLLMNAAAVPYPIRQVLKVIYGSISNKYPQESDVAKRDVIRRFMFMFIIIPSVLDPDLVGINKLALILTDTRAKLSVVANVLRNIGNNSEFKENSGFSALNILIRQNQGVLDDYICKVLEIEGMQPTSKERREQEASLLSPLCMSPVELDFILNIISNSPIFTEGKKEDFPGNMHSIITEINTSKRSICESEMEKYIIFNMTQFRAEDHFSPAKAAKPDTIKTMLRKILLSVNDVNVPETSSFMESLEYLKMSEKARGNDVIVASITDLQKHMKQRSLHLDDALQEEFLDNFSMELAGDEYKRQFMNVKEKLFTEMDHLQQHIDQLSLEKERCIELLEHERIKPFVEKLEIEDLINQIRTASGVEEQDSLIKAYFDKTIKQVQVYLKSPSKIEIEHVSGLLKVFILIKIYKSIMPAQGCQQDQKDKELQEKIQMIGSKVKPCHFDIPEQFCNTSGWDLAIETMSKLDMYLLPQAKLNCISKCCSLLFEMMKLYCDDQIPAADHFVPILIYVIIKASPPRLHANLAFIDRFIRIWDEKQEDFHYDDKMDYTGQYWITHFQAAIDYIDSIDAQQFLVEVIKDNSSLQVRARSRSALLRMIKTEQMLQKQGSFYTPTPPDSPSSSASASSATTTTTSEGSSITTTDPSSAVIIDTNGETARILPLSFVLAESAAADNNNAKEGTGAATATATTTITTAATTTTTTTTATRSPSGHNLSIAIPPLSVDAAIVPTTEESKEEDSTTTTNATINVDNSQSDGPKATTTAAEQQ